MSDRVCTTCWKWFGDSARVCPNCNLPLRDASAPSETSTAAARQQAHSDRRPQSTTRHVRLGGLGWLLITGALVIVVCGVFPLPQLGLWGNPGCGFGSSGCTRILFIGNSYTAMNDLPTTFASLAWADGRRVETGALDQGGSTLTEHAADPATASELSSEKWNVVVLQEQSEIPSVPSYRSSEMYPAATKLVAMIREQGAQPLFYLTFAHEGGWPQADLPNYQSMQSAIDDGYLGIEPSWVFRSLRSEMPGRPWSMIRLSPAFGNPTGAIRPSEVHTWLPVSSMRWSSGRVPLVSAIATASHRAHLEISSGWRLPRC